MNERLNIKMFHVFLFDILVQHFNMSFHKIYVKFQLAVNRYYFMQHSKEKKKTSVSTPEMERRNEIKRGITTLLTFDSVTYQIAKVEKKMKKRRERRRRRDERGGGD
jgi:hypothetical protein